MTEILQYFYCLLALLPFVLMVWVNAKANLKREERSKQFLMPIFALIYCILLMVLLDKIHTIAAAIIYAVPNLLMRFANWLSSLFSGQLSGVGNLFYRLAQAIEGLFSRVNVMYILMFVENFLFILVHIILKKILLGIFDRSFHNGNVFYEKMASIAYAHEDEDEFWYVKEHFGKARNYLRTAYVAAAAISVVTSVISIVMFRYDWLKSLFYPAFGLLVIGEIYFFLDGKTKTELLPEFEGIEGKQGAGIDFRRIRDALRKLFGDKLDADDSSISLPAQRIQSNDEILSMLEDQDDRALEIYGRFLRQKAARGLEIDQNYLLAGEDLLRGKSILFNNPFFYDLIPYVPYAMNRALLQHKKVLIVLGRHDAEEDAAKWVDDGLTAVTNIPGLWNIGVLSEEAKDLDVGILTRSSVHDLQKLDTNREFFEQTAFVVLLEPSKLVTTAQVGLHSIVSYCRESGREITYCSMDKNCDGLLDALSHILMTNLVEVAATNHHDGISTYMCWTPDEDFWQHRMLPNIARYLGVGTELAFAGLKNQASKASWFGGDAFPVRDMHWIARQYYYDLLNYANRPAVQEGMETYFHVSPNLWTAKREKDNYMVVEDEAFNMFEVRRDFATRAKRQGFVNVITSDYLLKDYMAENNGIFNADPKAIPYITADYAHTKRNVILRLCLRMSVEDVCEDEVKKELLLIGIDTETPAETVWHELCLCCEGENIPTNRDGRELLKARDMRREYEFTSDVINQKRKYSMRKGVMETVYFINNPYFIDTVIGDLRNAGYIAEDEEGTNSYLGSELRGHIFQKFLPGQFFTLGGKYYEMLRMTPDGRVLVRRAADHINGRPMYRQVRHYEVSAEQPSEQMGDQINFSGLRITREFADVRVKTDAYWEMKRYNDFTRGHKTMINGIPEREYRHKQLLRVELPENATKEIYSTIVVLLNEVFRTLFAENQDYIIAVMPGEAKEPMTYSLAGPTGNCIYIIEDSQLDIGLLEAVKRNFKRILAILCDYLDWHLEAVENSKNPPVKPTPIIPANLPKPQGTGEEDKKKKKGGKLIDKVKNFFGGLFKKRKKKGTPEGESEDKPETETETVEEPATEAVEEPVTETENQPEKATTTEMSEGEATAEVKALFSKAYADEGDGATETGVVGGDTVEFEPEVAVRPANVGIHERLPYHERYYLLYCANAVPEMIDITGTRDFLSGLGFGKSDLKQARDGKTIADLIEKNFVPNKAGVHYCDFCGAELIGNEYERLSDGRERCLSCGRTAIKSAKEFQALYKEVHENMETFYGIRIPVSIHVEMCNAKKLHRKLKKNFVPTGGYDGRTLGVAIQQGKEFTILLENGAPRLQSIKTMAHELTHIWQFLNWDPKKLHALYGKDADLLLYEGMAMWSEIQYTYLIGEMADAKREEIITSYRKDEYGIGFLMYKDRYPLSEDTVLSGETPFMNKEKPL